MISSPELREGTPAACKFPDLPRGLDIVRRKLAPGWSWRVVFGQGYVEATAPAPPPDPNVRHVGRREVIRKTIDVQVPVGSVTLRCRHLDGRRAVAGWVWRTDKEAWSFSGPAYCWMPGMNVRPYECNATEWAELMAWTNEEMAA